MAKDFSDVISEVMPLVKDGDTTTPFIIYRKTDDTNAPWFVSFPYPAENARNALEALRKDDPCAVMFTGADFSRGSFPYVYDKVFAARLRAEYNYDMQAGVFTGATYAEPYALVSFFEDYVSEFSSETLDYLTRFDRPLTFLHKLCPLNLAAGHDGRSYTQALTAEAVDQIERRIEALIARPEDKTTEVTVPAENELFRYNAPPQKDRAHTAPKPDFLAKINNNKQKVKGYAAANAAAPTRTKNTDKEV
jgi:hypothetical protein